MSDPASRDELHAVAPGPSRRVVAVAIAVASVYVGFVMFPVVFSGFAVWHDESFHLAGLRSFVEVGGLYSDTFSPYGPAPFAINGPVSSLVGLPLDSFAVSRVATLLAIVGASAAGAVAVWSVTRMLAVAIAAQIFLADYLRIVTLDPMHPGHLITLLLAVFAVMLLVRGDRLDRIPVVVGAIGSALVLAKVNVGAYLVVASLAATLLSSSRRSLKLVGGALLVLVPLVVAGGVVGGEVNPRFALTGAAGAILASVVVAWGRAIDVPYRRWIRATLTSAGAVAAVLYLPVLLKGTTPIDLVRGVLVVPARLSSNFGQPYPIEVAEVWLLLTVVAAGSAIVLHRRAAASPILIGLLHVVVAVSLLVAVGRPHVNLPQLMVAAPLVALPGSATSDRELMARRILLAVAVLQPLHAFPVAGAQIWWGSFLLALVGFVILGDGLWHLARTPLEVAVRSRPVSLAGLVVLGTVIVWNAFHIPATFSAYRELEPLDLPGGSMIHVESDRRSDLAGVTELLEANCDTYYSIPGISSFYVFAEMPLPTGQHLSNWPLGFDDEVQRAVVADLEAFDGRMCVVRNDPLLEDGWLRGNPLQRGPLVRYLDEFDEAIGTVGDYVVARRTP